MRKRDVVFFWTIYVIGTLGVIMSIGFAVFLVKLAIYSGFYRSLLYVLPPLLIAGLYGIGMVVLARVEHVKEKGASLLDM